MDPETTKAAFDDELQKIAGEMQGFTRIGRKPISIDRMLERELEPEQSPSTLFASGAEKVSAVAEAASALAKYKTPGLLLGGVLAGHALNTANQDRKLGKQIRTQQQ